MKNVSERIATRRLVILFVAALVVCSIVGVIYRTQTRPNMTENWCNTRDECARLCEENQAKSCRRIGYMLEAGFGGEQDWKSAAMRYDQACRKANFDACADYAALLHSGHGVKRDPAEARAIWESACKSGVPRACMTLADKYRLGQGIVMDVAHANRFAEQAVALYRRRCDNADAEACGALAERMKSGNGIPQDKLQANALGTQALTLRNMQCRAGDVISCSLVTDPSVSIPMSVRARARKDCDLGFGIQCYLGAKILHAENPDHPDTVADVLRACTLGVAAACNDMGERYEEGRGVARDMPNALSWFRKAFEINRRACDAGDSLACSHLAESYLKGRGIEQNETVGTEFANRALKIQIEDCELGDAPYCQHVGFMLRYGYSGTAKDLARAATFFKQACDRDARYGCDALADLYEHGEGVPHDDAAALALRRKACNAEEASSCFVIGEIARGVGLYETRCAEGNSVSCGILSRRYANGEGVLKDEQKAAAFREKACLFGGGSNCSK